MNRTKLPIRKRIGNVPQLSGSVEAAVAENEVESPNEMELESYSRGHRLQKGKGLVDSYLGSMGLHQTAYFAEECARFLLSKSTLSGLIVSFIGSLACPRKHRHSKKDVDTLMIDESPCPVSRVPCSVSRVAVSVSVLPRACLIVWGFSLAALKNPHWNAD
ncbi:hypothetical protein AgCh_005026 [Apium graveolens]